MKRIIIDNNELQWGRAAEGPERKLSVVIDIMFLCFNGAGPLRARRELFVPRASGEIVPLQWGRAAEGPERPGPR